MSQDNTDITKLSREELEQSYQLSQWALTWAVIKAGGSISITPEDMKEFNKTGQLWYGHEVAPGGVITTVGFRELDDTPRIQLLS